MTRQDEATTADVPEPETTSAPGTDHHEGAQEATGGTLTAPDGPTNRWDREQAREAGKRGGAARAAQRRRDREETELAAALGAEGAALGLADRTGRRTSAADSAVIQALERAAGKGDVAAARALLDWRRLDSAQGASPEALSLALLATQLPSVLLAALRSTVLDLVRQHEAEKAESPAQQDNRQRSLATEQPPPSGAIALAEPDATPPSDEPLRSSTARTPQSARDSGSP